MSMAWTILLALVAGAGGHSLPSALDQARPAADPSSRAQGSGPSRSLSAARKCWHRASFPGGWSLAGLEEVDTEEVDETWMVHLDAVASVPSRRDGRAWSHPGSALSASVGITSAPDSYFPLRC